MTSSAIARREGRTGGLLGARSEYQLRFDAKLPVLERTAILGAVVGLDLMAAKSSRRSHR